MIDVPAKERRIIISEPDELQQIINEQMPAQMGIGKSWFGSTYPASSAVVQSALQNAAQYESARLRDCKSTRVRELVFNRIEFSNMWTP